MTPESQRQATERIAARAAQHAAAREKLKAAIAKRNDARPMAGSVLMASLASVLPDNVAVVEEAVTTTNTTLQRLAALKNTSGYFGHRGWALGWGLGCALGVKLAWPDRPVLAILGEGAAMYGIQGLWSAARYNLAVTFVICNNAQYQILKSGAASFGLPAAVRGEFVGMDLAGPEVDMVALAGAGGSGGTRYGTRRVGGQGVALAGSRRRTASVRRAHRANFGRSRLVRVSHFYAARAAMFSRALVIFRLPGPVSGSDKTRSRMVSRRSVASMSAKEAWALVVYQGRLNAR